MSQEITDPIQVTAAANEVLPHLANMLDTGNTPKNGPGLLVSRRIGGYTQGAYVVTLGSETRLVILNEDLQPSAVWVGTAAEYKAQWGPAE